MSKNLQISLAAARVNASLTQEAVAKELRVSKKTVINWEKGAASPSLAVMKALSDMYQIPIDNIILPLKST
ncbi:MAG: helix-turn-helix transcriptional regulator [Acetatifactor sp.]